LQETKPEVEGRPSPQSTLNEQLCHEFVGQVENAPVLKQIQKVIAVEKLLPALVVKVKGAREHVVRFISHLLISHHSKIGGLRCFYHHLELPKDSIPEFFTPVEEVRSASWFDFRIVAD
jgi:hypothetical protein